MVTRAFLLVCMLAQAARAESIVVLDEVHRDTWHLLGTRVAYGSVPVDDQPMTTMSIAVSIDRPIIGRWRVLGEYEYVWIGPRDLDAHAMTGVASLADSGHRVHAGMRRRIVEKTWARGYVGAFVDAEAGGGAMLVDRASGSLALPHAFAGVRAGLALEQDTRWEYEVILRALAVRDGAGVLFGIGLVWGE
jgi:hypothetical protein